MKKFIIIIAALLITILFMDSPLLTRILIGWPEIIA